MDIDDDDDFYAPDEPTTQNDATDSTDAASAIQTQAQQQQQQQDEGDLEEGEEEDEGADMDEDDSDIDIITERKDGTNAPPPTQSRYSDIRNIPQRSASSDVTAKPAAVKKDNTPSRTVVNQSSSELPAVSTSKVDVNAIPVYKPVGKPITQVNIDEDLPENDKPWRKPGTDLSDYFNYGFDEFTWALYAAKQDNVRNDYSDASKKMLEDMQSMFMMGGMPGMSGANAAGGMPNMPGMDGMPPEMQAMMQQMMASGMDPSQMDASSMSAMFAGMQNAGGNGGGGQGGQNNNFGGGGQGFGGNQGQNFGYEQGMGGGGGGGGGGRGGFGRGRGGRRNW
ncbi:Fip1 motif-domain-containing protein [Hypoxylon rubiginosum]|uniref:Fip1 motif-domain-containing protein n=1 Tax=Hypoxylon rubiginosum TaxID=110542 RepID=A0ACC0D595_9PEZI|nr:Fip1 motif-domain-containing protein [Hypoxylon rubiginosum]